MGARKTAPRRSLDWRQMLVDAINKPGLISRAYSIFWTYSLGNQVAALVQCLARDIEPGPIHTYRGWQELGRQVKKGEKALVLTLPVTVKRKPKSESRQSAESGTDPTQDLQSTTYTAFVERPFWFTLSQTEGPPYMPVSVPEWDEARALEGLNIRRTPFHHPDGNCQGYARGREVSVSPIAFLSHRTLFHEMAHVLLGHTAELTHLIDDGECTPRDLREVEAECAAMLCCSSLGMPGEEFSRGYIQHWWRRQEEIPEASVHKIFKAADAILRAGRPSDTSGASRQT